MWTHARAEACVAAQTQSANASGFAYTVDTSPYVNQAAPGARAAAPLLVDVESALRGIDRPATQCAACKPGPASGAGAGAGFQDPFARTKLRVPAEGEAAACPRT